MWFMIVPGIVSLVFGLVFILAPKVQMQDTPVRARPLISIDGVLLRHRIGTGICLIAVGAFCLFSAFYVWYRLYSY